jgi:hypothetical protein
MLGVSDQTLANANWMRWLSGAVCVKKPDGGRCKLYPVSDIEQIAQERLAAAAAAEAKKRAEEARLEARAAAPPFVVSEGFVDRAGARSLLRITERAFTHWITDGKITFGTRIHSRVGGRCTIYPVEALKALRAQMLGRENLFKGAAGTFEVPSGWARRREACQMFGVDRPTWDGWVRQGLLPCGERFEDGPTVYRVEELKRMLQRAGMLAPPYLHPDGSGAYCVPLCGGNVRDSGQREAIVDAQTLALLDGAVLSWESVNKGQATFVGLCRPERPKGVALRRVIMGVTDGAHQVGHINGDSLDCRSANLIVRTIQQRTRHTRKMKGMKGQPCSSRFKGVCWEKWTGKWSARIVADGKAYRLGRFGDELAAAEAYDEAARELFGEHARLNFPDGIDAWLDFDKLSRAENAEAAREGDDRERTRRAA